MNVMAHILVVFLVIAGNIFGASSGVEDFVPQPPETHKRFFSLVTSKSVIMNRFITVKESSYHGFSDGLAVTILECM